MSSRGRVVLVDYGMGNLGSVARAFGRIGCEVVTSGSAAELRAADRIVLPGGRLGARHDGRAARQRAR